MRLQLHSLVILSFALFGSGKPASIETNSAHSAVQHSSLLTRHYREGETLTYEMKGSNNGWNYQIRAKGTVKKDDAGVFYEEYAWSDLRSNAPMKLSDASLNFHQTLSLDQTSKYLTVPNLSQVQPSLIGPITDLLTFYSDAFLAEQQNLTGAGDHAYFPHGKPNSWADGNYVVLGQDAIDFDITLLEIVPADHSATLLVRHVPPTQPQIQLPAEWMRIPVKDTPNNWVEVEKKGDKYLAEVGKETFEVHIKLDTNDGKILTARLDNPVAAVERECADIALSKCGNPQLHEIRRSVELTPVP